MPKAVQQVRPVNEIRNGDIIEGKRVEKVDRKVKYTYLHRSGAERPLRVESTQELQITRMEPTDEEIAQKVAERREDDEHRFMKKVREYAEGGENAWVAALSKQRDRLAEGWNALDHWTIDELLAAGAYRDHAQTVKYLVNAIDDGTFHHHPGQDCVREGGYMGKCTVDTSDVRPFECFLELYRREAANVLKSASRRRVLSRSTSVTANLVEDLAEVQRATFLDKLRYEIATFRDELSVTIQDAVW